MTGAGDGIGRGIALALAREGAAVAVCDINAVSVAETGRLIADAGRSVLAEALNITDHDRVRSFVDDVASRFGRLDVLVNNAAIMPVSPIEEQDEETMSRILSVNLLAPAVFSKYCTPHMRVGGRRIDHPHGQRDGP